MFITFRLYKIIFNYELKKNFFLRVKKFNKNTLSSAFLKQMSLNIDHFSFQNILLRNLTDFVLEDCFLNYK